jgi:Flp pilus assembly protein TadG
MNWRTLVPKQFANKKGTVAVLVGLLIFAFIGFAALAIDIGHLFVVRNELQNAADAAALAGAHELYLVSGSTITVNVNANQVAYDQALFNNSERIPVEAIWKPGQNVPSPGTVVDIQRGHWSFGTHTFTASDSTNPPDITKSTPVLDADPNFINAVQATARRQDKPAASFFAQIFGYQSFLMEATAVAYIGFAGSLEPGEADMPIAVCQQALRDSSGNYNCRVGRFINSSGGGTGNTGAWTNFTQLLPDGTGGCGTANPPSVRGYVSGTTTVPGVTFGAGLGTIGGNVTTLTKLLYDRWKPDPKSWPTKPFPMRLLVIDCKGYPGQVDNCSEIVGVVDLNMLWMNITPTNKFQDAPKTMWHPTPTEDNPDAGHQWTSTSTDNEQSWIQFVNEFDLQKADGTRPYNSNDGYMDHTLYFLPSCKVNIPTGRTGGKNYGVLAKIPVLVK